MSKADIYLNQAKAAYEEARRYRHTIQDKQHAETINIQDALNRAEQAKDSGEESEQKYWSERADLMKDRLEREIADLERMANDKHEEGKRHESEARGEIDHEDDKQKRNMLMRAFEALVHDR